MHQLILSVILNPTNASTHILMSHYIAVGKEFVTNDPVVVGILQLVLSQVFLSEIFIHIN